MDILIGLGALIAIALLLKLFAALAIVLFAIPNAAIAVSSLALISISFWGLQKITLSDKAIDRAVSANRKRMGYSSSLAN